DEALARLRADHEAATAAVVSEARREARDDPSIDLASPEPSAAVGVEATTARVRDLEEKLAESLAAREELARDRDRVASALQKATEEQAKAVADATAAREATLADERARLASASPSAVVAPASSAVEAAPGSVRA